MTKRELSKEIAERNSGFTTVEVENMVNDALEIIENELMSGGEVTLRGFGTFKLQQRKEKKARDINRGKFVIIPAYKKPVWKPAQRLINYFRANTK